MTPRARRLLAFAATFAVAACLVVGGGCVSKPPEPESAPPAAPEPPAPSAVSAAPTPTESSTSTPPNAPSAAKSPGSVPNHSASGANNPSSGGTVAPAQNARPPAQTSDERRAALDKRLNDSLGVFDAKLKEEQQQIARDRDARQSSVVTVAAVADNDGSSSAGLNRDRSNGGHESHERHDSGDLKSEKAANGVAAANAGNGATAKEVPDGSDDDLVARRIRKAAEQETDPELKDKLWKEYVEYKKNTHAR